MNEKPRYFKDGYFPKELYRSEIIQRSARVVCEECGEDFGVETLILYAITAIDAEDELPVIQFPSSQDEPANLRDAARHHMNTHHFLFSITINPEKPENNLEFGGVGIHTGGVSDERGLRLEPYVMLSLESFNRFLEEGN